MDKKIEQKFIDTVRVLSVDQVQKANSGHPGMPLGAAPTAVTLWANHIRQDAKHSKWINRDRFVLSAGHASALLYSLLHLFGYDVTQDDLKQFRQFGSKTAGHPEYGHAEGIEATTGPLGAGLSTAVGMAMAQAHLAAKYNREGYPVFDNFTYVLGGDGCMMEGITSEASSLAGSLALGRLIVLYDSNNITIEGNTDLAFRENVRARYEAYGFETFLVEDGNDIDAINAAIEKAKSNLDKPSFIEIKTRIGAFSALEGSEKTHGSPLGEDNVRLLKETIGYPSMDPFYVAPEVYDYAKTLQDKGAQAYNTWAELFASYEKAYPELAKQWAEDNRELTVEEFINDEALWDFGDKAQATRNVSGDIINRLSKKYSNLFGGSADLAKSNMTAMGEEASFQPENYAGRNLHFGVREHAMAAMGNGIVLYGGLKSYVATFFVFADFLKPMARLSSIMHVPLTYVLTHDSIGVGEDGPTHEPIEQLAMLRAQPNFITFRPADARETMAGWTAAMTSKDAPVGLVLSRQNLPQLEGTGPDALKGAYVLKDANKVDVILIATGSEVSLALDSAQALEEEGVGVRVVSMPSFELFEKQSCEYKESVLPRAVRSRVAIEAASSFGWERYIGFDGKAVTIDTFGASGKGDVLFKEFGFTVENVVKTVKEIL
ncbi:transketolase [Erysipelothrix larvae]|uniref:Transketolase n=1 Tax=Erysipelothrix larvae TaxID=1514105 RepID=A0A120JU00_9FIRM|nr:transketolase [Erysipelothrix larvae]AMC94457.1 transketolase [Erysipelothrix larvae]